MANPIRKKILKKTPRAIETPKAIVRFGNDCLTDGKIKMLTEDAKRKIFEINDNVDEDTVIELPEGLLVLNILNEDVENWNDKLMIKVPTTILGYISGELPYNLLLPSFLEGTNIADCYGRDYYKGELPQRKFCILGTACGGFQLIYKAVEDEDEASGLCEDEYCDNHDHFYSAIPTSSEYDDSNCWKLVLKDFELGLYSDDAQSDIQFDIEDSGDTAILLCSAGYTLFEEEVGENAAVMVRDAENCSIDSDEAICSNVFDPRLLKKLGCNDVNDGVWTLRYDDRDVDWTECCTGESRIYYCDDGGNYSEM